MDYELDKLDIQVDDQQKKQAQHDSEILNSFCDYLIEVLADEEMVAFFKETYGIDSIQPTLDSINEFRKQYLL